MRIIQLILIILLLSPFVPPVDDGGVLAHFTPPDSLGGVGAKIASEEENIDSFDVSPASGRWNVTSDDLTDDLVTDSILRMTTINNETSGSGGFAMDRGMSKTDGKVEYRMAASGGGNQTEFFRDVIGDKCDFEEGDVEGLSGLATNTAEDGIYIGVMAVVAADNLLWSPYTEANTLFNNISAEVYHTIRFRMMTNESDLELTLQAYILRGGGSRNIGTLDVPVSEDWTTYEITLSDDPDWIGAVSSFRFRFEETDGLFEGNEGIFIDWIELIGDLDFASNVEGEIEDTWDWEVDNSTESWTGLVNMNVSEGFLRGTMGAGIADIFISPAGLSIDTSLFEIVKVRMNTSDVTMDFIIEADLGAGNVIVSSSIDLDSTSQTVYEIDLSDDSDWSGTCNQMQIRFDELDDTLDGDEIVFIDYILLLGHWADSDSVIGLWDQDDLVPLLNVSSHFTSNNSHPTTSDKAYFTVELLDLDGEVSYSAISDNYTDVSDSWIQGKITYDVLRSRLVVTINWDNLTRIEKWTFPADFTVVSGRIPALFSHSKSPSIFTSTFCQATSWQEMKLDFIRAPFKEREWNQLVVPTDTDWLIDRWDYAYAQDNIDDTSLWTLIVPYLDTYSGTMTISFDNTSALGGTDSGLMRIYLYGVDADDGDLHVIGYIALEVLFSGGLVGSTTSVILASGVVFAKTVVGDVAPRASFSISLQEDRSIASFKGRCWPDRENDSDFYDFAGNETVANAVTDVSMEFVIAIYYEMDFDGNTECLALIEDIGITEKDIFSDIANAIVEPLGNFFQQIFVGLFRFFAGIFKGVGDLIIGSVITMQTAVTAAIGAVTIAINQIQGWLTTLGATITGAIANIEGWLNTISAAITGAIADIESWLNTIASTISDAIADIAADIWTALGTAAADVMDDIITALTNLASDVADFIDGVIQFLIPLLLAIAADLADLFVGILDALIAIGGDILAGIMNFLAEVIFFIWEALGLPDILAVFALFIAPIVEIVTGLPGYVTEIGDLIAIFFIVILGIYWFWLIFLAFAEKGFDIFAGFGESVSRLFTFWNFSILGIGPIPFPIALFFIPLTYFFIIPSGSVFAIW